MSLIYPAFTNHCGSVNHVWKTVGKVCDWPFDCAVSIEYSYGAALIWYSGWSVSNLSFHTLNILTSWVSPACGHIPIVISILSECEPQPANVLIVAAATNILAKRECIFFINVLH